MRNIVKVIIVREGDDENDPFSDNAPEVMNRQQFKDNMQGVYTAHMNPQVPDRFEPFFLDRFEEGW